MQSPYKYDWNIMKIFTVGWIVICFVILLIKLFTGSLTWDSIVAFTILSFVSAGLGFSLTFCLRTLLNTKVKNPVNPNELIPGEEYYLNGTHKARYSGKNKYTQQYIFYIAGVQDEKIFLYGQVAEYFSAQPENKKETK